MANNVTKLNSFIQNYKQALLMTCWNFNNLEKLLANSYMANSLGNLLKVYQILSFLLVNNKRSCFDFVNNEFGIIH
jgi:hypothetical protein